MTDVTTRVALKEIHAMRDVVRLKEGEARARVCVCVMLAIGSTYYLVQTCCSIHALRQQPFVQHLVLDACYDRQFDR
jgi:hypothetical protein